MIPKRNAIAAAHKLASPRAKFLLPFLGQRLKIQGTKIGYIACNKNGAVVLCSDTETRSCCTCPSWKLQEHRNCRNVRCVWYGHEDIINVSVECEDCGTIIYEEDIQQVT